MGIFSRLADIINSNVNSLLDRAEDPEKMIRLIIQEMEETLVEVRAAAAKTIAERKEVERSLGRLRTAQEDWVRKAEVALAKGREDLSKAALVEKAKLGRTISGLAEELARLDEALAHGQEDIAKLAAKLDEAKSKQKALMARHETAGSRLKVRERLYDRRVDDAFARFEQVERRLDETEGRVAAFDLGQTKTLVQEIEELEAESEIEAELARLKARLAAGEKAAEER